MKPKSVEKRMGIYKRLSDVPEDYLLQAFEARYAGRDVWAEYCEENGILDTDSQKQKSDIGLVERSWKAHMDERGRHHALANPIDVERWLQQLLNRMQPKRAYNPYFVHVEGMYDWLQWHIDHDHRYHPVLMACAKYEAAKTVWDEKVWGWQDR